MGPLIRLCLHNNIRLWFIPVKEPWRNGVVEKFNDHYDKKFLRKVEIGSETDLIQASHYFEYRHNSQYRYSKLGGKTPLAAMESMSKKNAFSTTKTVAKVSTEKTGYWVLPFNSVYPQRSEVQRVWRNIQSHFGASI
jgi:putative transposase